MSSTRHKAKVVGAHAAALTAINLTTSMFLHRGETHGSVEFGRPAREAFRATTWVLSGMKPREWVGVHRRHHKYADTPLDPHSPVQNGRFGVLDVFLKNGLGHYRKAAKQLTPDEIPQHLQPDRMDRALYDKGWLGLGVQVAGWYAVHRGGNVARPAKAVASAAAQSFLVHSALGLSGGGFVNSFLHRGEGNVLETMVREPRPHEDGSFTVNSSLPAAIITVGEGNHDNHHDNQGSLRFNEKPLWDLGGVAAEAMIRVGLAQPGTGPRT